MSTNFEHRNRQTNQGENSFSKDISMLHATFDLPLYPRQIPQFRGALTAQAGWEKDQLHNHNGKDKFHYRYPLIHYRVVKGKAAVVGIGEGAETLRRTLLEVRDIQMNGKKIPLRIEHLSEEITTFKMLTEPKEYRLMDWLPLNQENYQTWKSTERLHQQVAFLDKMLVGQIITLCNGINWRLPNQLYAYVTEIHKTKKVKVHQQEQVAFNVSFKTNIDIPSALAIGRAVAFGYGTLYPFREKTN